MRAGPLGDGWPPGEYWPANSVVINQYTADGEIACFAALCRGLKRRYGDNKVLWWVVVAILVVGFGFL